MKKPLTPASLAVLASAALVACATGSATDVTDDVSLTEAPAKDEGGTRLPPSSKEDAAIEEDGAGPVEPPDGGADASDAALDAPVVKDAAPDAPTTGTCGTGSTMLGEYATWYGKVNVHRAAGGLWVVDSDCSSGANVNTVAYCQKYWPTTSRQVQLAAPSTDGKPFTSGGGSAPACGGVATYPGQTQYVCCTP